MEKAELSEAYVEVSSLGRDDAVRVYGFIKGDFIADSSDPSDCVHIKYRPNGADFSIYARNWDEGKRAIEALKRDLGRNQDSYQDLIDLGHKIARHLKDEIGDDC